MKMRFASYVYNYAGGICIIYWVIKSGDEICYF